MSDYDKNPNLNDAQSELLQKVQNFTSLMILSRVELNVAKSLETLRLITIERRGEDFYATATGLDL